MTGLAAHVCDLDGVVRDLTERDATPGIEAALGLPAGHVAATAYRPGLLLPTITGRRSFDEWCAAICLALEDAVPDRARVAEHMVGWREHRGTPIAATVAREFGWNAEQFAL